MTRKQAEFIRVYIEGGMANASEAYRQAYKPGPNLNVNTISKAASELLQNPRIASVIADAKRIEAEAQAKVAARYVVTKARISEALALMAFADPRDFYDWQAGGDVSLKPSKDLTDAQAGAVQAVSSSVTKYGRSLKVELADRRGALMDLAKLHGHVIEKKDVRVIRSLEDLSEAELVALAEQAPPPPPPEPSTRH